MLYIVNNNNNHINSSGSGSAAVARPSTVHQIQKWLSSSSSKKNKNSSSCNRAIELAERSIKVHQSSEQHVANCSNAIIKLAITPETALMHCHWD